MKDNKINLSLKVLSLFLGMIIFVAPTTILGAKEVRDEIMGGNGNTGQAPYTYYDYDPGDGDFRGYFRVGTNYNGETAQFVTSNVSFSPKDTFMIDYEDGYIQYIENSTTTEPASWTSLSQEQKDKMGIAYSYGAQKVQSEEDLDWLMAIDMVVSNKGEEVNTTDLPEELGQKVNQINKQVKYYNSPPSFMESLDSEIILNWNSENYRYEATLTDDTGIFDEKWLDKFLEISGQNNIYFENPLGENNILIYTDDPTTVATFNLTKSYMPDSDFTFSDGVTNITVPTTQIFYTTSYYGGNTGANMVTGIDYEAELNPTIKVNEAKGNIKLSNCGYTEEEMCEPLENSEFRLEDEEGNGVDTQVTDSNGELVFSDVLVGDYKVHQSKVDGKYILNETIYEVSINEDGEEILVNNGEAIQNELVQGGVEEEDTGEEAIDETEDKKEFLNTSLGIGSSIVLLPTLGILMLKRRFKK